MKKISILITIMLGTHRERDIGSDEDKAKEMLSGLNKRSEERYNRNKLASWNYESNITEINLRNKLETTQELSKQHKEDWLQVNKLNWTSFEDYDLRRQFKKKSYLGNDILPKEKNLRLNGVLGEMKKIYATAKICTSRCDVSLEPVLLDIFENSRNPEELKHVWREWRYAVGPKTKQLFTEYVALMNEAARLNNYTDVSQYWLDGYEDATFTQQIEKLWQEIKPLYLQIHAFVRTHLRKKFGDIVTEDGPIPAHLLGDMWAQNWRNLAKSILPHPEKKVVDFTEELQTQNYTRKKFFKTAEEFFKSINLTAMPKSFWTRSIFEKPKDRAMVCHASAWDMGTDVRIKMCTDINMHNFITAHHEMGHVEYYLQYKNQPITYRHGANDGFHEAIGDLITLSVQSPKHLRKIGLLHSEQDDPESALNTLFQLGLAKIAFLPFAYVMQLWQSGVFKGTITPDEYNCKWWQFREEYQGLEPPVDRSNEDFDPASKYHILANVPYLRYFISNVIQFQFHRSLCEIAGQYRSGNPLHECDIYQSTAAGNKLKKMLEMGSSRPWHDAIEVVTGQRTMDASALLEYFRPLQTWLEEENKKSGAFIGWKKTTKECS